MRTVRYIREVRGVEKIRAGAVDHLAAAKECGTQKGHDPRTQRRKRKRGNARSRGMDGGAGQEMGGWGVEEKRLAGTAAEGQGRVQLAK